jgi:hypothetical protein
MTQPTDNNPTSDSPPADVDTADTSGTPEPEQEPSPNGEAARWRTKLRDTETQRDALTDRLTGYQRRECEAAVADLLDEPGDLWEIGQADVSAFYGDDGALDEAELRAAAGALCELRPKLAKPQGPRWKNFGQGSKPPPQRGIGWDAVLKQ